jgi:putative inorganic carbon (HCO3(-)) transporter
VSSTASAGSGFQFWPTGPGASRGWPGARRFTVASVGSAAAVVLVGLLVGVLPVFYAAAAVAGALLLVIGLRDPRQVLLVAALLVPIGTLPGLADRVPLGLRLVDPVVFVALVAWIAAHLSGLRRSISISPWSWSTVVFVAVVVAAIPGVRDQTEAVKEGLLWVELLVVFWITADLARSAADRRLLIAAILCAGLAEALLGFVQFFLRIGPPSFVLGSFLRAYGTFGQPNPYAGYLESVVPIAAAIVLLRRSGVALVAWRGKDWLWRLALIVSGATGAALLMSFSRGAWLGITAGVVAAAVLVGRFGRLLGGGVIGGAALGLLYVFDALPGAIAARLNSIVNQFGWFDARFVIPNAENWATVERMAHWQVAVEMFLDHPIFGVGPGQYPAHYAEYAIQPYWLDSLGHAHNMYLNVAAELGIVGFATYLVMVGGWLLLIGRTVRRLRRDPSSNGEALAVAVGVGATVISLAVHNVFDNLYVNGMNVQLGILLGLVASLWADQRGEATPHSIVEMERGLGGAAAPEGVRG